MIHQYERSEFLNSSIVHGVLKNGTTTFTTLPKNYNFRHIRVNIHIYCKSGNSISPKLNMFIDTKVIVAKVIMAKVSVASYSADFSILEIDFAHCDSIYFNTPTPFPESVRETFLRLGNPHNRFPV